MRAIVYTEVFERELALSIRQDDWQSNLCDGQGASR